MKEKRPYLVFHEELDKFLLSIKEKGKQNKKEKEKETK